MIKPTLHDRVTARPRRRAVVSPRAGRKSCALRALPRGICVLLISGMVSIPALAADVMNGAKIYARHCAACHGPAGMSVMPGAPNLARGERLMQPDQALLATLKAGRNAMPAYVGVLADREILDVIAYSRSLRQ